MKLEFKEQHISIDQFNPIELTDFTVLTGVNGSGKSHLLDAIRNSKVVFSDIINPNIVLFNYETFKLEQEPSLNAQQLVSERTSAWQYLNQKIKASVKSWRANSVDEYEVLKSECTENEKSFFGLAVDKLQGYNQNISNLFNHQNHKTNNQAQGIYSVIKKLPYSIDEMEQEEFNQHYKPITLKNNFLPNQLGKIFWDYYAKKYTNEYKAFRNTNHNENNNVLDDVEFINRHGRKPWDVVNDILDTFDSLQYRVNSPEGIDYYEGNYQLKLIHTEKENLEIQFTQLSSGEKILMALVASIYKASSDGLFPDILLLDEVDASLHPSMMKNMLNVIENVFIKEGVKVILVTHSPTTIALAPPESIFIMNKSGENRIEKKSKQEALSILTQGFATIEEGLKLFDEITRHNITIISEGKNTLLIEKALELYGINDVTILSGIENISGKSQLKTLFDFLSKINHDNKVIFIWDCDVKYTLDGVNNTYPYIFLQNEENKIAKKGIENIFPSSLFTDYIKTIRLSDGTIIEEFDESRKRNFESFIIDRSQKEDFLNFSALLREIERIKKL